jgi:flagellar hook-associated protein 1 FlgK
MGLDSAMNAAISGLTLNQEAISVSAQNIANVNTPGYSRRIIVQEGVTTDGVGQGVELVSITRSVNEFLVGTVRDQTSVVSSSSVFNDYLGRVQTLLGNPDANNNLSTSIDNFFSAIKVLATSPELDSLKIDAVNKAGDLVNNISSLARGLQQLRYSADNDINTSVNNINGLIGNLRTTNIAIASTANLGGDTANLEEQRDNYLTKLAQELDITAYYQSDGEVQINAAGGKGMLDQSLYKINYNPQTSVNSFINNLPMASITASIVNIDGSLGHAVNYITAGLSEIGGAPSTVVNNIKNGNLYALQQLRDVMLPQIIDQLDSFAASLSTQFNALHNTGGGFPPSSTLTGTRPVINIDARNFSGSARIGIVDDNGKPIIKADGTALNPLTLNLATLQSTNVPGQITVQTIMDEINQYFSNAPAQNRASIGNIYDIKIAATSNLSTEPGGTLSLDLDIDNSSQLNSTVQITGVTVSGGCVGLTSALPAVTTAVAGTKARTGQPFTINFAGGGGGPYTVTTSVKVTDSDGNVSTGTISYSINDNPGTLSVENTRYPPTSVSGTAVLTAPAATSGFATAQIVDSNGIVVTAGNSGVLQIAGTQSGYHIIIDDLDSQELGLQAGTLYSVGSIAATGKGLSGFFELNDFFVRNPNIASGTSNASIAGTAINMQIRSDILNAPSLISTGKLAPSPSFPQNTTVGATSASATFQMNANPSIADTITINGTTFTFVAAAGANNQITIGGTLATTLVNTVAKLSALNSTTLGTVDQGSYSSNGLNTLNITYNGLGTLGNGFTVAGSFATVGVQLNGGTLTTTPSGNLVGGTDQFTTVSVTPWSYEIAKGSKEVMDKFSALSNKTINFIAAGGLPASSNSLSGYLSSIFSYNTVQAQSAINNLDKQNSIFDGYNTKALSVSGVNLDQEIADTIKYQNAYGASARIISVTKQLYDVLFDTFK